VTSGEKPLKNLEHKARRDGPFTVTLPDGQEMVMPESTPGGAAMITLMDASAARGSSQTV